MTAQYKQQPQQLLDELVDTFQDWYDVDGDIDRTWHPWYDPNIHGPGRYHHQPQQLLDELVDTWHDWYDTDMVMDPNYPGVGDDTTWHPIEDNRRPTAKIMDDYINLFLWMDDDYKPIDEKNAEVVNDKQSYFIYNTFYNIGFL